MEKRTRQELTSAALILLILVAGYAFIGDSERQPAVDILATTCDSGPDQIQARLKNTGNTTLDLDAVNLVIYQDNLVNDTLSRTGISLAAGSEDVLSTRNSPDISQPGNVTEYTIQAGGTIIHGQNYTVEFSFVRAGVVASTTCLGE